MKKFIAILIAAVIVGTAFAPVGPEPTWLEFWGWCDNNTCRVRIYHPHVSWVNDPPDGWVSFRYKAPGYDALYYVILHGEDAVVHDPGDHVYLEWVGDSSWIPCRKYTYEDGQIDPDSRVYNVYPPDSGLLGCGMLSTYLPIVVK